MERLTVAGPGGVTADDVAAAAALAARHTGVEAPWQDALSADLVDPRRALFVARVDACVVGYGRVLRFTPSDGAPPDVAPAGWYLAGLLVDPSWRRSGIGDALTAARLEWLVGRADTVWYFANARNEASLDLHRRFGFEEVTTAFTYPGVTFDGGVGVLCRARLSTGRVERR